MKKNSYNKAIPAPTASTSPASYPTNLAPITESPGNIPTDRIWAVDMACQKERSGGRVKVAEIGVRVI